MHRITSQLCEVFDCSDRELKASGVLEAFNRWLADNSDIVVSNDLETGEEVNLSVAQRFYASYKDDYVN